MKVRDIEVGSRIGESSRFRIYLGKRDDEQSVIFKIAKTFEDGDVLANEASKFNAFRAFAEQIAQFEKAQNKKLSHYDWLFANLESSFLESTQGYRRVNVFTTPDTDVSKLTPLTKLRDEVEIDVRTSVWILGRFFKIYAFFELMKIGSDAILTRYPLFSPDDYLIGPERHRLIYYNYSGEFPDVVATDSVKEVVNFMLEWIVVEDDATALNYYRLLKDFAKYGRGTFEDAHRELYDYVRSHWGIKYHPFTYRERGTVVWKPFKEG